MPIRESLGFPTSWRISISKRVLPRTSQRCGRSYVWQPVQVFVLLPFPVLWRIMMDFIQHGFPQTCCKHKEIILGPIRCSELTEIHRNIFTIDGKNWLQSQLKYDNLKPEQI